MRSTHPFSSILILLILPLLTACTPREQELKPANASPTISAGEYRPGDGAALPLRVWQSKGKAKAVIIALHGFNDYSNAFEMPGRYFASRGILTYAYDQRGFGAGAEAGIWGGQENLTRDVKRMVQAVHTAYPHLPIYLLGESMGGAVVISALAEYGSEIPVRGAILSAPAVWGGATLNPLYRFTLWFGAHSLPWKTVTGEGLKIQASDNIPMLKALGRDPLIIKKTRVDAIYGLVHLMDNAYTKAGEVELPLLVLYGAKDQVIPEGPVRETVETLGSRAQFRYYDEGWHMLMRDLQSTRVCGEIVQWIGRQNKR